MDKPNGLVFGRFRWDGRAVDIQAVSGLHAYTPYCGAAPEPWTLVSRWNLDPVLLSALAVALAAYLAMVARTPARTRPALWRRRCFHAGWALGAMALVSPLCALSVSLFSARWGQHMILEMIAAPLIALGAPRLLAGGRSIQHQAKGAHRALLAAAAYAATLWFWHAPGPYRATFDGAGLYWLMHVTSFASALWLWREVLEAPGQRMGECLAAMFATTLQMGFLGALLTFAVQPFYGVHALTTQAWGLSPLEDQQLGGVLMWIPAGSILLTAIIAAVALTLRRPGSRPFVAVVT